MSTYPYAGSFSIGGTGVDGADVSAYATSRFAGQPALNDPVPDGDPPDATATTGTAAGFDGAYAVPLPDVVTYYVLVVWEGVNYWTGPVQGAGAGGSSSGGMPIANPTGAGTATETPDSLSGADTANWVTFPTDPGNQSVMAWGIEGNDFPNVVFDAYGNIYFGDGTFDPILGPSIAGPVSIGASLSIGGAPAIDTGRIFTGAICLSSGNATPDGIVTGGFGDEMIVKSNGALFDVINAVWVCISGTAWKLKSITSFDTPASTSYTPPNLGATWQDLGGGGFYIATGTSSPSDWTQITVP